MNSGLCPGNYFDYPDDEVAIQREFEIGDSLTGTWIDDAFPPNARSLYFDPLNPPKGSIPNESIKWSSICEGDVNDCEMPITFSNDNNSSVIQQGALGNGYFVNALRILSCHPKFITRILVSEKFSTQGLYTIKFYKAGKWRYVHIDDRIPCRQSGRVHFCRNHNPNETFAMLIEKAYAKLHGCYEATAFGLIDKAIHDLTPGAGVSAMRLENMNQGSLCDDMWDVLETAISENRLVGCGRFVPDPYGENPSRRCGVTLGHLYQVVDICTTSAEPTEDLDALTVGMVCVRNLQKHEGRFNGRWSFGDHLWLDYKEIAFDLRHRTREIQYKRGLGPNPNETDDFFLSNGTKASKHFPEDTGGQNDNDDNDDEPDTLDMRYIDKARAVKVVQPVAEDLHWLQIEDFVEIFNRVTVTVDLSFERKATTKVFSSRWIAGDYLAGGAGPPIVITKEIEVLEGGEESLDGAGGDEEEHNRDGGGEKAEEGKEDSHPPKKEEVVIRTAVINDNFTDNPMYPFSVSEPCNMCVTLYQADKRWNVGRLGEDPKEVRVAHFASRTDRLRACMEYSVGLGFVVMRLSGLKWRVTEFKLRKIVWSSEGVQFSNVVSRAFSLLPGRYAIVPFTHCELDRSLDYVLHAQYLSSQLDFEVEDVIAQRLTDADLSVDGEVDEDEQDDNDLLRVHDDSDDVSIMSFERVVDGEDDEDEDDGDAEDGKLRSGGGQKDAPPRLKAYQSWEYTEDTEELGLAQVFSEVGDLMKYMRSLRGEVRKLHGTMRAVSAATHEEGGQTDGKKSKVMSATKRF